MTFEEAKVQALAYFEENGTVGLASALETENYWIFYGGQKGTVAVGKPGIKINRETGELSKFFLPNKENFALLKSAVSIDIQ